MYQIQIIRFEPRSEDELKEIRDSKRYGRDYPIKELYPDLERREGYKAVQALNADLTDEQFEAVRKAVLEVM